MHIYAGDCPDDTDSTRRDPDCQACRALSSRAAAIIDGALFVAHQAGMLGHDIGTLSEWRDALLALRAPPQDVADLDGMAMELWAMSQGNAPIMDRIEPMAERLREFAAAVRAQALEDAARIIDETWHRTPAEYAAAIRALKEKT